MTLSYNTVSHEKTEYIVSLILKKEEYFKTVY